MTTPTQAPRTRAPQIDLASPWRGKRLAGKAVPTRSQELVQRFLGGFLAGATLVAAIVVVAVAVDAVFPDRQPTDSWTEVVTNERIGAGPDFAAELEPVARLGASLRLLERSARPRTTLSSWIDPLPADPAGDRAARLLAHDVRARLSASLAAWENRAAEIADLPPEHARAAVRVLALLHWQLNGGELTRSLAHFEDVVARAAVATPAAAEAESTPEP